MALSVHTQSILRLIAQLANSDLGGETLSTQADVRALAHAHDFSPPIRITSDDAADLRALRTRLRAALIEDDPSTDPDIETAPGRPLTATDSEGSAAESKPSPPDARASLTARAAQLANELFRETRTLPQLQKHDQWDWHLHAVPNESGIAVRAAADIAIALADVIIDDEASRFGTCSADDCTALFVDLSRNRSKRFCDLGNCANRTHVAAYRARLTD